MARIKMCLMNSNKEVRDPVKDTFLHRGRSGASEGDVGGGMHFNSHPNGVNRHSAPRPASRRYQYATQLAPDVGLDGEKCSGPSHCYGFSYLI